MVTWALYLIIYASDGMWPLQLRTVPTKAECVQLLPLYDPHLPKVEVQCIPVIHIDHEGTYSLE